MKSKFQDLNVSQLQLATTIGMTDELILTGLMAVYELLNSCETTIVEDAYFKTLNIDDKFYRLKQCFNNSKKIVINNKDVTSFNEFITKYPDDVQKTLFEYLNYSSAYKARKADYKYADILRVNYKSLMDYFKVDNSEESEMYYDNFCDVFDIKSVKCDALRNFYNKTYKYGEEFLLKNDAKNSRLCIDLNYEIEKKSRHYVIDNKDVAEQICANLKNAKVLEVYDSLTDKGYYVVDVLGNAEHKNASKIMEMALTGSEEYLLVGAIGDKFNLLMGKSVVSDGVSYTLDIFKLPIEIRNFYYEIIKNLAIDLRSDAFSSLQSYRYIINDFIQVSELFVANDEFRSFVCDGITDYLFKVGFGKRVRKFADNPEKLAHFLQKCEESINKKMNEHIKKYNKTKVFFDEFERVKPKNVVVFPEFE